ncbi:hypothetical protein NQ774_11160 [Ochrobactrum sp. BD61]
MNFWQAILIQSDSPAGSCLSGPTIEMPGKLPGISVFNPGFPGFFHVDRLGL